MHPVLFDIKLPHFITDLVKTTHLTVYTYAVCIVAGAIAAAVYIKKVSKNELGIKIYNRFFYVAFLAGFIGGKLLFFLEKPGYNFLHFKAFITVSGGFVIYGSLIAVVIYTLIFSKVHKINALAFLDIIAAGAVIPMITGRIGCFWGGCCYGKQTTFITAVVYPTAEGIQQVHPVQLYDAFILSLMFLCMVLSSKYKHFKGQMFLVFTGCYAISRFLLEFLRGDFRGNLLNGFMSHSQCIAIISLLTASLLYWKISTRHLNPDHKI